MQAKKNLNWEPTYSIKNNIKLTIEWYKRVYKLKENPLEVTSEQIDKYMHDSKIN